MAGAVALGGRAVGGAVIDAQDAEDLVAGGVAVDPEADGRAVAVAALQEGRQREDRSGTAARPAGGACSRRRGGRRPPGPVHRRGSGRSGSVPCSRWL